MVKIYLMCEIVVQVEGGLCGSRVRFLKLQVFHRGCSSHYCGKLEPNVQHVIVNKSHHRSPPFPPPPSPLSAPFSTFSVRFTKLQDAVMVGLHTCGDLAPSTLRMFVAKPELAAVCSVGCCYHLLSEEFDPAARGNHTGRPGTKVLAYIIHLYISLTRSHDSTSDTCSAHLTTQVKYHLPS